MVAMKTAEPDSSGEEDQEFLIESWLATHATIINRSSRPLVHCAIDTRANNRRYFDPRHTGGVMTRLHYVTVTTSRLGNMVRSARVNFNTGDATNFRPEYGKW
jgi:hypothetical protein